MEQLNSTLKSTVKLAGNPSDNTTAMISKINQLMAPPIPVTAENAHIRIMYLASDSINAHGGRFPPDELHKLVKLIPGTPVLVGHRRDRLPIARSFNADYATDDDGVNWVRSYFYWMKDAEGAETLRLNIDSGIYTDCSLCFSYSFPECSICGEDMRRCPHMPLQSKNTGSDSTAFYYYRGVNKVIEVSLVYRGANWDTRITGLSENKNQNSKGIILTTGSGYGGFNIGIRCGGSFPLPVNHHYSCTILTKHTECRRRDYVFVDCSAFLQVSDGIPYLLYIEDSPLKGIYRFSRVKSGNGYHLIIHRED